MTSTPLARLLLRLRDRALRCYEIFLYALLVSLALLVAMPTDPAAAAAEAEVQCGKIHSSAVVISR